VLSDINGSQVSKQQERIIQELVFCAKLTEATVAIEDDERSSRVQWSEVVDVLIVQVVIVGSDHEEVSSNRLGDHPNEGVIFKPVVSHLSTTQAVYMYSPTSGPPPISTWFCLKRIQMSELETKGKFECNLTDDDW